MKRGIFGEKIPIFGFALLRFAPQLRLTDTMKESEFTSLVLPLRDRMFRYAQSLLLSRRKMPYTICWSVCGASGGGWKGAAGSIPS